MTASSSDEGNGPENLTDGQTTTRWSTRSTAPATLTVDLGSVQTVGAVEVDWTAAAASSYTVEVSADGSTWTRASRHRNATGPGIDRATFDAHEARFVRLSSVVGGPDGVGAWRLSVLGRPDLALGAVATASGVEAGTTMTAVNVVDGDPSTRWSADYSAQPWVQVDLGTARTVDEVTLRWEAASATAYRVEVSQDGTTWSPLATRTGLAGVLVPTS
ncbi:discoidin domain-containing protein [Oerskovia sp. M15]